MECSRNLRKIYLLTPEGYKRADQINSDDKVIYNSPNINEEFTVAKKSIKNKNATPKTYKNKTKTKQKEIEVIEEVLSVSSSDSTNNYIEPEFVEVVPIKTEPEYVLDVVAGDLTDTITKNVVNSENNDAYIESEFVEIPVKQELAEKLVDETNFDSNVNINPPGIINNFFIPNEINPTINLITPNVNLQNVQTTPENYNVAQNIQPPYYVRTTDDYIVQSCKSGEENCILKDLLIKNASQNPSITSTRPQDPQADSEIAYSPSYAYVSTPLGYQRIDLRIEDQLKQKLNHFEITVREFNHAMQLSLERNPKLSVQWLKERALQILTNFTNTKTVINKHQVLPYLVNLNSCYYIPLTITPCNTKADISSNADIKSDNEMKKNDVIIIEDESDSKKPKDNSKRLGAEIKIEIIPDSDDDELHSSVWIKEEPMNYLDESQKSAENDDEQTSNFSEELDDDDILSEVDTDDNDEEIKTHMNSNANYAYIRTSNGYERMDTSHNQDNKPVYATYVPTDLKELADLYAQGRKFVCNICGKPITQKKQYDIHYKSHDIVEFLKRDHTCEICNKSYHLKRFLSKHMFYAHTEKHISCDVCNAKFKTEKGLKTHKAQHENEKSTYFECEECGKIFVKRSLYNVHLKTHGSKMFKCTECDACFKRKDNLTSHVKMHKGQKDYKCNDCGKEFVRSDNLKRHMVSHSTVRPYKCDVCDKQFKDKIYLKHHTQMHKTFKRKRKTNVESDSSDSSFSE